MKAVVMDAAALEDFMAREFPQAAGLVRVEAVAPMRLTARMAVTDAHLRPGGTVSGPTLFALADIAFYLAVLAMVGPKALAVTTSAAIDFLRKPAAGADLVAEVRLLKLGRTLAVGDVLVFPDGSADAVARASLTYALPPADRAAPAATKPEIIGYPVT